MPRRYCDQYSSSNKRAGARPSSLRREGVAQKRFENLTEDEAAQLWVEEVAAYIMSLT